MSNEISVLVMDMGIVENEARQPSLWSHLPAGRACDPGLSQAKAHGGPLRAALFDSGDRADLLHRHRDRQATL